MVAERIWGTGKNARFKVSVVGFLFLLSVSPGFLLCITTSFLMSTFFLRPLKLLLMLVEIEASDGNVERDALDRREHRLSPEQYTCLFPFFFFFWGAFGS